MLTDREQINRLSSFTKRCFYSPILPWFPAIIICAAMLLAAGWVFLVPVLQSPDEDLHADYVFSLYTRGRLFQGKDKPIEATSHPFLFYLLEATNGQAIKWNPDVKMPEGYGTANFFEHLDKFAPNENATQNTNPAIVAFYPFGYYAATALWLGLFSHFNHSISFLFFAARLFSVILLGIALSFSFLAMKELRMPDWQSCLLLAAIGFFPLTSFIGSYIQPDNLSFAAMSACFFLALRWRNKCLGNTGAPDSEKRDLSIGIVGAGASPPTSPRSAPVEKVGGASPAPTIPPYALGVAMAILLVTKYQFFSCTAVAIAAMIMGTAVRARISFKKLAGIFAALVIPSLIAGLVQLWVSWHCKLPTIDAIHWHWFATNTEFKKILKLGGTAVLSHIWHALADLYQNIYQVNGVAFQSFWGYFGWLDTPLIIGSSTITSAIQTVLEFGTKMILVLTLASLAKVMFRLWQLVSRGRWRLAVYIAYSNPVINSYFLFTLFILTFAITVYPSFGWQGRHWFPFILSIFLTAACFAPRVLDSKIRRKQFFLLIAGGLLIYSLLANYFAFGCIYKRYYVKDEKPIIDAKQLKPSAQNAICSVDYIDYVDFYPSFYRHRNSYAVPAGAMITVNGWAIDQLAHLAGSAVLIYIDGIKARPSKLRTAKSGCGRKITRRHL